VNFFVMRMGSQLSFCERYVRSVVPAGTSFGVRSRVSVPDALQAGVKGRVVARGGSLGALALSLLDPPAAQR